MDPRAAKLLTLNSGSSSLKVALYAAGGEPTRLLSAEARAIGETSNQRAGPGQLKIRDAVGNVLLDEHRAIPDHAAALQAVFDWLAREELLTRVVAVGHRVVHGGLEYQSPTKIDATVVAGLRSLVPLAPDHLPQAIATIEQVTRRMPDVAQVACFDTEFHRSLPPRARTLPIPHALSEQGVVRFGFHGLSYEYLVEQLRGLDPSAAGGRAVLAHLGNGASMAAVLRGESIDTSMGFTPAGGLVMSSRSGDLDPGVLVYLLRAKGYSADELNRLINQASGLVGISELSSSMETLLGARASNPRAALAVEIFCYQARKQLSAYAGALEGLDTIVFSGGIGENSAEIRHKVCTGLEFLSVRLDPAANAAARDVISATESRVTVRVIRTDEDQMIARHTCRLLALKGEPC